MILPGLLTIFAFISAPVIEVLLSDGGILTVGENHTFTCNISGIQNLNSTIVYKWTKNNGTQSRVGTNSNTLSFFSLRLSDSGEYTCMVTITSAYLNSNISNTTTGDLKIESEWFQKS